MIEGYYVPCECGKKLIIQKSQAGQEIPCECGKRVAVPTLRGFAALEPAQATPGKSRSVATGKAWSRTRGLLSAFFMFLFALSLAVAGYYAVGRHRIIRDYNANHTVQDEVRDSLALIDQQTPAEVWQQFREMRKISLQSVQMPEFYMVYLTRLEYEAWIKYALILAASSLGLGLLVMFWPRSAHSRAA